MDRKTSYSDNIYISSGKARAHAQRKGAGASRAARCAAACLLALTSPVAALAQSEDSWVKEIGSVGEKSKQINALDHRLQGPRVTKQFDDKRIGKHLYIDLGVGGNVIGTSEFSSMKPSVQGGLNVGAWITPEHGVRIGVNGGSYRTKYTDGSVSFYGVSADYMINANALAARHYKGAQTFEVYPFMGADLAFSSQNGVKDKGIGAHVGIRGQLRMSNCSYFYVEPRVGIIQDNVPQFPNWRNFRPVASVMAGFGYRVAESEKRVHYTDAFDEAHKAGDGWIVSMSGGFGAMFTGSLQEVRQYREERVALGLGKWFGNTHGVRLTANAFAYKQGGVSTPVRGAGVQADYMLNLHSFFMGYTPERRYWLNALVGGSYNFTTNREQRHKTFGFGVGLQPNVRITQDVSIFLEPRVDLYQQDFAPYKNTSGKWDIAGTVMAGLTWTSRPAYLHRAPDGGEDFVQNTWHDHMFVEVSGGANIPVVRRAVEHPRKFARPSFSIGFGKWFTPLHGLRFWTEMAQTQWSDSPVSRYKHSTVALDYLFNFSNAASGYRRYRPLELVGGVGVLATARQHRAGVKWFGVSASLKGIWNLNPLFGLYLESKVRGYGDDFFPTKPRMHSNLDFIAQIQAGMHFNMNGYLPATYAAMWDGESGHRSSISVAAGMAMQANHPKSRDYRCPIARISYTHWYSPVSAWRASVQGYAYHYDGHKMVAGTVGVDAVTDLTAQTYGFDPGRVVSVLAMGGFNVGMDYSYTKTYFAPDFHFGGQFNVRLSDRMHLYVEPQLAYRLSKRYKQIRKERWLASAMMGLDYNFRRAGAENKDALTASKKRFVSVALGTGEYTVTTSHMHPFGRKLTFFGDVNYGQWLKGVSGYRFGVSNTLVQVRGKGNENITAVHLDYVMNLRAALTGKSTEGKIFQLTGFLGATANMSTRTGQDTRIVMGLDGGLQAGWRVTPSVELFLEPSASLYGKHIQRNSYNYHPFEGEARLSIGTKYCF